MTSQDTTKSHRRSVLKGAAVMLGGTLPVAGTTAAKPNKTAKSQNWKPLEGSPSKVAYLTYEFGEDGFGFPDNPAEDFFVTGGPRFDTTALKIAKNGEHIRHSLPFPGGKPYIIKHKEEGRYSPRGAVINFEIDANNEYGLPEGQYRATVREEVQLYGKGGYFNWSVSRVDLFSRPGMNYLGPSLAVIWDEDGPENDDSEYRNGPSASNPGTPNEVLADEVFSDLAAATEALIKADIPNPGGK